jgi:hypothetical protein
MSHRGRMTAEQPCVSERVDLLFFGAVDRLQDNGIGAARNSLSMASRQLWTSPATVRR